MASPAHALAARCAQYQSDICLFASHCAVTTQQNFEGIDHKQNLEAPPPCLLPACMSQRLKYPVSSSD